MSDDYKLQLSTTVNGNLLNIRANTAEELVALVEGLATASDGLLSAFVDVKQAVVAKDIFTGNAKPSAGGPATSSSVGSTASGDPTCKHGPMKDLRSKGYKSDFYCTESNRDAQCKPVKL